MFFKLTAKNAYRDLIRNARRITVAQITEDEKANSFSELYKLLKPKLYENESCLNSQAAFAKRCQHWNERTDIKSIRPVKNTRNPWLQFKREFEAAIKYDPEQAVKRISIALAWFYQEPNRDDWLVG